MKKFWDKVNKQSGIYGADGTYPTECWLWNGYIAKDGYGDTSYKSKTIKTHRLSWILEKGDIPNNLCVLHRCDYRKCVNIGHLFLGSRTENCEDMRNKNRHVIPLGSHNGKSKLKEHDISKLRELYSTGKYSHRSLGKMFNINHSQIGQILRGNAWKHVI